MFKSPLLGTPERYSAAVDELAPFAIAVAAILGALIGALVTVQVNRARINADEAREYNRWLSEQRLRLYIEAHHHQRDLVFIADGIILNRRGHDHRAFRGDPDRYRYSTWLRVFDDLNDVVAGLRLLGADQVADDLRVTLDDWRASELRRVIKDTTSGATEPLALPFAARQPSEQWWGSAFFERIAGTIEIGRRDIESLAPKGGD